MCFPVLHSRMAGHLRRQIINVFTCFVVGFFLFNLLVNRVVQSINEKPVTSSVKLTDEKPSLIVEVFCVFAQREVSSDVETSANDVHIPVSETDSRIQPVVVTAARQTTVTIKSKTLHERNLLCRLELLRHRIVRHTQCHPCTLGHACMFADPASNIASNIAR